MCYSRKITLLLLVVVTAAFDLASKFYVQRYYKSSVILNSGVGLGIGLFGLELLVEAAAVTAIIYAFISNKVPRQFSLPLSLVLGGGAANLVDRLSDGYIVDFIRIRGLFTFNLADVFITAGILFLLYRSCFSEKKST